MGGTKELGPELMPFLRPASSKPEPTASPPEAPPSGPAADSTSSDPVPEGRMQLDTWKRPSSDGTRRLESWGQPPADTAPRAVSPGRSPTAPLGPTPEADGSIRIPVEVRQGGRTLIVLVRLSRDDQSRFGYTPPGPPASPIPQATPPAPTPVPPAPPERKGDPGPRSILDLPSPRLPDSNRLLFVSGGDGSSPPQSGPAPTPTPPPPAPVDLPETLPPPPPTPKADLPEAPPPADLPAEPKAPVPAPEELEARAKLVRQEAEGLWREKQRDGAAPSTAVRKIERNMRDVNDRDGVAQKAAEQVMANLDLEKAEVAKLPPDQQMRYQGLVDATRYDPGARLALQVLLNDGKLIAEPRSKGGKDLLGELCDVADRPVAGGLDATALLGNVLQDVATPGAISQQNRATCSVATLQILTASQDPAEYVRIVGRLASPRGTADLRDGSTLQRLRGTEYDDGTNRSTSSRLWQPALMDFAKGGTGSYSNYQDVFVDSGERGLGSDDISTAIDALGGTHAERLETWAVSPAEKEKQFAKVLVNANSGKPVPVAIKWGAVDPISGRVDGLHEVLVTAADKDRVYYTNPWGMEESMGRAEFKARMHWAHLPG